MDPLLHFFSLHMSRAAVDSPELARRRETLRDHDREARSRRSHRRRERVRQAVAFLTARRWRGDREAASGEATKRSRTSGLARILMVLALAGVGLLASRTAAEASVVRNTTVSYAYAGWVPCANGGAGELVTGTIDTHLLETSTANDGVDSWQFMFAPRGTLVGQTTGESYRLTSVERGTYVSVAQGDRFVLTYVTHYHLIGPGSGNNLVVRETAHVTSYGDTPAVQFDDYRIECG